MTPKARIAEYVSVASVVLAGGLWLGRVATTAADTSKAVDGLPAKVATIEMKFDERTAAIKEAIEELKKAQAEQARLILEEIRKK
jgi:outer membrane murein-binding lipoprotein Lpp